MHLGVKLIAAGWSGFVAENLILSHYRRNIIDTIGETGHTAVYSTLSTAACLSVAVGYFRYGRAKGPKMWNPKGRLNRVGAFGLQGAGLLGISQMVPKVQLPFALFDSSAEPEILTADGSKAMLASSSSTNTTPRFNVRSKCPIDFNFEKASKANIPADGVYGMKRVSRHPQLWSLGLLGMGTALASAYVTEVLFFSGPLALAFILGAHMDHRFRRGEGGDLPPEIDWKTSNIPFLAFLLGRQQWSDLRKEMKVTNAGAALLLTCFFAI